MDKSTRGCLRFTMYYISLRAIITLRNYIFIRCIFLMQLFRATFRVTTIIIRIIYVRATHFFSLHNHCHEKRRLVLIKLLKCRGSFFDIL